MEFNCGCDNKFLVEGIIVMGLELYLIAYNSQAFNMNSIQKLYCPFENYREVTYHWCSMLK